MDIIFRLRLLLWLLVFGLWGAIAYQYLQEDDEEASLRRMHWISNPFPSRSPPAGPLPQPATPGQQQGAQYPVPGAPAGAALQPGPPAQAAGPPQSPDQPGQDLAAAAPPGSFIKPLIPKDLSRGPDRAPRQEPSLRRHEMVPPQDPAVPAGFYKTDTRHFIVLSEKEPAPQKFLDTLEYLHGNIMLDLAAFSPWARDEKVTVFVFRTQESYRKVTGRPAWSGGASSVSRRRIYLYESEELVGILAHELCHIYFDSFFAGAAKGSPLWLSEGLATLVQVERGLAAPNWLPENLRILTRGGGYNLDDLVKVDTTAGANDDNVRLWYTQAYSVTRFLVRSQWKSSFYHFCRHLRDGRPFGEALYRGYGMPFNRARALEYAWRYDLKTRDLTGRRANP